MNKAYAFAAVLALLAFGTAAQADVFNLGAGFTNLETVRVDDAGNVGDLSGTGAGGRGADRICGSVGYIYNIGKYEVTTKQYTDFLNAKAKTDTYNLYNSKMANTTENYRGCNIQRTGSSGAYTYYVGDDYADRPVNYVSYWDSCRFANWLSNGQGNGDTETGAYSLNGYNSQDGRTIQRNDGWKWAVTSEDEWYKAAYYKGGNANAGFWDYATQCNNSPGRDLADDSGNNANYWNNGWLIGSPYYRTEVGEFQSSESAYGTLDQAGNIMEWNEAILYESVPYIYRGLRGGSYTSDSYLLQASDRNYFFIGNPIEENYHVGFRVVQAVPEPSSILVLASGLIAFLGIKRRRA